MYSPHSLVVSLVRCLVIVGLLLSTIGAPAVTPVAQALPKMEAALPQAAPSLVPPKSNTMSALTEVITPSDTILPTVTPIPLSVQGSFSTSSPEGPKPDTKIMGTVDASGGQLVSPDGRVTVNLPAKAVDQAVEISYGVRSAAPLVEETGTVLEFELGAQSGGQAVDKFDQPIEVKLNLKGLADLGKRAPQTWLRFELEGEPPLPVQANPDEQSVSAKVGRPGRVILSITPGAPGVWALQYTPPSASLFNGSLTHQVPINVPPGRNGMQPNLALSYSSGKLLGRTGDGYESRGSGPIGDAWSLDGLMTIARERWYECYTKNSSGDYEYYTCFDDIFVLTLNGTGYELTPVPAPPAQGQTTGRYYAKDGPGLYIERRNNCDLHDNRTGNCQVGHATSNGGPSTTGEYWIVRTSDGQEARLGYTDDFQLWTGGNPVCNGQCKWGDAKAAYQGYKGQNSGKVTRLWAVDQIVDTYGNKMTFTYSKDEWVSSLTPRHIYYNYNASNVAQSHIYLEGTDSYNDGSWINALYAYNKDASGNDALARYYVLGRITNSHRRWNGNPNWVYSSYTTLAYVQEKDAWSNVLPAQTFAYEWYNSGDYHDLQWLAYVNNGYGATTRAVYEKAGGLTGFANADGCNNYRLQSLTTMGGFGGTPIYKTYTYGSPCYDYYGSPCQSRATSLCEQCTSGNMQTLVGYDVVTEKVWDSTVESASSEHYFYNANPEWRKGREWKVRQIDPATSYEMARTETTWAQGSVQGTATAFGYVAQEQATSYTDNAPVGTIRKSYSADWYGNVYAEYNYGSEIRLPDASFEGLAALKTDCSPEGWSGFWLPNIPAARTGAAAFAGSQSLQLSGSSTGGACQDVGGLTPGVAYQARVWVSASVGTTGKFRLWLHDTTGANAQISADIAPPTNGTWQQVIVPYTANATGKVRIHLYYPITGTGTIYVDEVALARATDVGDETSAQRAYYANTANGKWIVNKLAWQNEYEGITQNVGGSAMKRQTINYYDGATAYTTPPAKGALTKSSVGLGSLWQTSQATYDSAHWYVQIGTTDAGGHTSSTAYDTQYYLYPTSVTDASGKTATFNYDKVKGLLLSTTDPNGAVTSYEYDGLGRLLKVIKPYDDSTYPTTRHGYAPPQATSLYPYGDFEAGTGWTLGGGWSAGAINWWGYTAGQGLGGSKALQVNTHLYANTADGWIGQAYGSWAAGQTHMIGAWVRSPAGGWVCMSVSNGMNETTLSCVWASSSWQYMGGQISLPAESTQMLLLFRFWTPSVTYYVDNVVIDGMTPLGIMEAKLDTASGVGATMDTFSYYDGLGRVMQTRLETQQQAQQSVVNVEYDGLGREKYKYAPAFEAWSWSYSRQGGWNARPRTVTAYDALGQVSQVTAPDSTVSKMFYNGFQMAAIDANNHQKISVTDGRGFVVAIKEYNGAYSTVNWNATPYATTSYIYDAMGNLTCVTDAANNQTNIGYDALGRKISMSDPDMGSWVYRYDNDGLLITQINAKNNATNFYYDTLHRMVGKVDAGIVDRATYTRPTDPGYAGYTEKYYYDQAGHGAGIGQRTSMSNANASTSWTYDLRGRVTQESVTVPAYLGQTYTTQYTYYSLDQVATLTYPGSGEVIAPSYNVGARLAQVHSNDYSLNYASGLAYNAMGQLTQMTYGNNLVTAYDYYDTASELDGIANTYYSFRLKTLSVSGGLMNLTYNYDKVGNVKMRNDAGATESFGYDALDRLTSVSGPYSAGYTYTSVGNIDTKTEPPSGTSSYGYDASHKHAVTTLNGVQKFWYDANGNMTKRIETGGTYIQTWTYNNQLDTVTVGSQTTQFLYDADGNRVMRKNADGSMTLYVGGLLEVDLVPPAAPSNLSATAVSPSQLNLTWTDNSNNEDGFRIERAPDGINWTGIITVGANTTTYQNTGLTCGATYYYRVRAFNNVGSSAYSNIASATTGACPVPPVPPSNLIATAISPSQLNLAWTDNSNNEDGFRIERSLDAAQWAVIASVSANAVTYSDVNLTCNTTYFYRVRAYNAVGYSPYSNIGSALTFLCAPSNLSATAVSPSQINLAWTDNSNNESGFKIERSSDSGNTWSEVTSVGVNVTTFSDSALACETLYTYRVRAFNQAGASGYSNTSSATTGLCAPSNLVAQAGGSTQIALNWSIASRQNSPRLGFKIERSTNEIPWSEIATVGANVWTYNDAGLACDGPIHYSYRVRAYNAAGYSDYSNISSAHTAPCAPEGLTIDLLGKPGAQYAVLGWKDRSARESGFVIERRIVAQAYGGAWITIGKVDANVTTYTDDKLACDTVYEYQVQADSADGLSDPSNISSVRTEPCGAPQAPSNLSAAAALPSQINLSWADNSTNESGFKIERLGLAGVGDWSQIAKVEANVTSYSDAKVECGKAFSYRVRAFNAEGDSDYSNVASATLSCSGPTKVDLRQAAATTLESVNTASTMTVPSIVTPTAAAPTQVASSKVAADKVVPDTAAPAAVLSVPANQIWRFYYSAGSTVAVREKTATTDNLYYLYGDALGSASLTTDASGGVVGQQRYYPYGDKRSDQSSGNLHTDFRFTGQRSEEAALGSLYDYGARFYSPALGRFISPDSIVPSAGNSDDFNRYSYVRNNPLKYIDPSGHDGIPVSDLPDAFQQFLKNIKGFYDWGITIQKDTLAFLMSKGFELGLPEGFMDNPNATLRYSNLDFSKAYLQSNWDDMDAKIIRAEVEMTAWRLGLLSIPEANSPSGDVLAGLNAFGPAGSAFATGFTGGAALISMLAPESYHNFWTHEKGDKNGFSLKLWDPTAKKGMEVVLATDETLYYHATKAHAELESAVGVAHTVQMVVEGGPGTALQTSMNIFAGQAGGVAGWIFRVDGALWNMAGRRVMQSKHVVPDSPIDWSAGW